MATNSFFRNFTSPNEQALYDDIIVESIKQYGHDLLYLPRIGEKKDDILNEYSFSRFEQALPVEAYIKNFSDFEGEGQLLAKFGLEIRDQMTLSISQRSFRQFIQPYTDKERPWEGDCIYIPMTKVLYQIKYVNTSAIFYTLGKLNTFDIVCEIIEFSNEQFNTGIPEIDEKYKAFENADDPDYDLESYDKFAHNTAIEGEGDGILDFSEVSPFSAGEE